MQVIIMTGIVQAGLQLQYALENLDERWRCIPAANAGQAWRQLQQGAEVLLLAPGRECETLMQMLQACPLLAPPYVIGLGWEGLDGAIRAAEELPPILRRLRAAGKLPALTQVRMPEVTALSGALLRMMDVPSRLRAWEFLPEMIALTVVHPPLLQDLRHGLYPLIARRHGMTAAGVERSLRLCVESTWSRGSLSALERFFGSSVDPERGKPTNREFLCRMQERVTLAMGRVMENRK